jgi:hypothetical protein
MMRASIGRLQDTQLTGFKLFDRRIQRGGRRSVDGNAMPLEFLHGIGPDSRHDDAVGMAVDRDVDGFAASAGVTNERIIHHFAFQSFGIHEDEERKTSRL